MYFPRKLLSDPIDLQKISYISCACVYVAVNLFVHLLPSTYPNILLRYYYKYCERLSIAFSKRRNQSWRTVLYSEYSTRCAHLILLLAEFLLSVTTSSALPLEKPLKTLPLCQVNLAYAHSRGEVI